MKAFSKYAMAAILASGLTVSSAALAADTNNALDASNTPVIARLANKLNLTEEQRTQIKEIVGKAEKKAVKLNEDMLSSRDKLSNMLNNNQYDKKKVEELAEDQGDSVAKMIELQAEMQHDILQVLTPEQRTELKTMIEDAQNRLEKLRAAAAEAQAKQGNS